jgi:hypothetical protein
MVSDRLDVVLWAYSRPEFTKFNVERLLRFPQIRSLYIAHDGLRSSASEFESKSHKATRELITNFNLPSHARNLIFDSNVGMTEHFFRVSDIVLQNSEGFVQHEDDKISNQATFAALAAVPKTLNSPQLIDTRNLFLHSSEDFSFRGAFTTINGVNFTNSSLVEAARQDYRFRNIDHYRVEKNLRVFFSSIFEHRKDFERLSKLLTSMLSWGLTNPNRPDSLLGYSLMSRGLLKQVSMNDLSIDVSHLDFRGANQEYRENSGRMFCKDSEIFESPFGKICRSCEVEGIKTRIPLGYKNQLESYLRFHLGKVFSFNQGPKFIEKQKDLIMKNFSSDLIEDNLYNNYSSY